MCQSFKPTSALDSQKSTVYSQCIHRTSVLRQIILPPYVLVRHKVQPISRELLRTTTNGIELSRALALGTRGPWQHPFALESRERACGDATCRLCAEG